MGAPLSFTNQGQAASNASADGTSYQFDSSWKQGEFNINTGTGLVGGGGGLPTWLLIGGGLAVAWFIFKKRKG